MPPCPRLESVLAAMKECAGGNGRERSREKKKLAKSKTGYSHPISGVSGHSGKAEFEFSLWTGK